MTSKVDIVNRALDKLGADTIIDLTQDLENARIMNRAYNLVLRSLLRSYTWNCSLKRVVLSPLSTPPAFGYLYQFQLPSDCLRPLLPKDPSDWRVEGKTILTNGGSTVYLRYIRFLDDPNDMDDCLVEAFACKLAMECAEKVTQSLSKRGEAKDEFREAMAIARRSNAYERVPDEQGESSWLDARLVGPQMAGRSLDGY
jgi:hypothetical protein